MGMEKANGWSWMYRLCSCMYRIHRGVSTLCEAPAVQIGAMVEKDQGPRMGLSIPFPKEQVKLLPLSGTILIRDKEAEQ